LEYHEDMLIFALNENVINAAGGWKRITDVKKAREKENWIKRNSDKWAITLKINNSNKIIGTLSFTTANCPLYLLGRWMSLKDYIVIQILSIEQEELKCLLVLKGWVSLYY
jgi:hypothetical protein